MRNALLLVAILLATGIVFAKPSVYLYSQDLQLNQTIYHFNLTLNLTSNVTSNFTTVFNITNNITVTQNFTTVFNTTNNITNNITNFQNVTNNITTVNNITQINNITNNITQNITSNFTTVFNITSNFTTVFNITNNMTVNATLQAPWMFYTGANIDWNSSLGNDTYLNEGGDTTSGFYNFTSSVEVVAMTVREIVNPLWSSTCSKLYVNGTGHVSCGSDNDTGTAYTNGSGLTLIGTQFNHSDTSSQASVDNSGSTFIQDIVLDTFGHITSIVSATILFPTQYPAGNITDLDDSHTHNVSNITSGTTNAFITLQNNLTIQPIHANNNNTFLIFRDTTGDCEFRFGSNGTEGGFFPC